MWEEASWLFSGMHFQYVQMRLYHAVTSVSVKKKNSMV
jgi:hypothetical protein